MNRRSVIYLLLTLFIAPAGGCGSDTLTRQRVVELLESTSQAERTISIPVPESYSVSLPFVGDTPEQAKVFAFNSFYDSHAELRLLNHVGVADFEVTEIKSPHSVMSRCTIVSRLSPRGLAVVGESTGQPGGRLIQLARREVIEVTGITGGEGESKQARAEFTARWVPTEIGRYFDISSAGHQSLPAEVRNGFMGGNLMSMMQRRASPKLFDASAIQNGVVQLERYDDGWRLVAR